MKKTIVRYSQTIIALIVIVLNSVGASASTPWTVNPSDYRYDMSLYLDVTFATSAMDYSLYEVGVFCGDECRGVAEVLPLGNGKSCLYLRARSNQESGETMTFKYYDKETQKISDIDGETFTFESDGRLGYPSDPYRITIIRYFDVRVSAGTGGTVSNEGGRFAEGTELTLTATPAEGYHFVKWSDEITENPRMVNVDEDLDLSAEFGANSYKLTYLVDGAPYKEYTVDYGTPITAEEFPEKEGHTFSGWAGLPETMPAEDVTLAGTFTVNKYKLTLYLNDKVYSSRDVEFGTVLKVSDPEVPDGMKFDGWSPEIPETMPAYDLDIYGSYSVETGVDLTFIDKDDVVSIHSLAGFLICKGKRWSEIAGKIENGEYVINGRKVVIRK